jgi:hypothetical protein
MALLRNHKDDLAALTAAAAAALGIDPAFVEKDFWVIEVLRAAAAPVQVTTKDGRSYEVQVIFKGGTSLSRVFELIERFSEDVDLLISFPDRETSIGARDKVLKQIRDAVAAHLGTAGEPAGVTTGVKRNIRYPYPGRYGSGDVTEGVLLEMGSRGGAFPTQQHYLRSIARTSPSIRLAKNQTLGTSSTQFRSTCFRQNEPCSRNSPCYTMRRLDTPTTTPAPSCWAADDTCTTFINS